MFKKDIYKYKNEQGRVVISPYKPEVEYEHMYRLIAQSEDYRLTDYNIVTSCIDIQEKNLELWVEVHKDDLETLCKEVCKSMRVDSRQSNKTPFQKTEMLLLIWNQKLRPFHVRTF